MTNEKSTPTIMIVEDYDDTRLLLKQGLELWVTVCWKRATDKRRLTLPIVSIPIYSDGSGSADS